MNEQHLSINLVDGDVFGIDIQSNDSMSIDLREGRPSGGTSDYNKLINKPSIDAVELIGDRSLDELGVQPKGDYPYERITNQDIEDILNLFV